MAENITKSVLGDLSLQISISCEEFELRRQLAVEMAKIEERKDH